MGKRALEGLKGVKGVKRGFRWHKEINTVYFNPELITIEEMVKALKDARTYIGTVSSRDE